jgi:hypothetical protein
MTTPETVMLKKGIYAGRSGADSLFELDGGVDIITTLTDEILGDPSLLWFGRRVEVGYSTTGWDNQLQRVQYKIHSIKLLRSMRLLAWDQQEAIFFDIFTRTNLIFAVEEYGLLRKWLKNIEVGKLVDVTLDRDNLSAENIRNAKLMGVELGNN